MDEGEPARTRGAGRTAERRRIPTGFWAGALAQETPHGAPDEACRPPPRERIAEAAGRRAHGRRRVRIAVRSGPPREGPRTDRGRGAPAEHIPAGGTPGASRDATGDPGSGRARPAAGHVVRAPGDLPIPGLVGDSGAGWGVSGADGADERGIGGRVVFPGSPVDLGGAARPRLATPTEGKRRLRHRIGGDPAQIAWPARRARRAGRPGTVTSPCQVAALHPARGGLHADEGAPRTAATAGGEGRVDRSRGESAAAAPQEGGGAGPGGSGPIGDGGVLVVDDDAVLALSLSRALEEAGLRVIGPCLDYRGALMAIAREPPRAAVLDLDLGRGDMRPGFEGERVLAILSNAGCRCVVHSGRRELFERLEKYYPRAVLIPKPAPVADVVEALTAPEG